MKKILAMLLCCTALLAGCGQQVPEKTDDGRLKIVATVFPAYDFARAAAGTFADVELLLPPGMDSHSYEPTPADILAVQECDLFIYLGGESDSWVETILSAVEPEGETLRMIDCVKLLEEEHVEGMQTDPGHDHDHEEGCEEEHHHEDEMHEEDAHGLGEVVGMDEHVWTAPENAAAITRTIGETLAQLDGDNGEAYLAGAEAYAVELDALHVKQGADVSPAVAGGDTEPSLLQVGLRDQDIFYGLGAHKVLQTGSVVKVQMGDDDLVDIVRGQTLGGQGLLHRDALHHRIIVQHIRSIEGLMLVAVAGII